MPCRIWRRGPSPCHRAQNGWGIFHVSPDANQAALGPSCKEILPASPGYAGQANHQIRMHISNMEKDCLLQQSIPA